MSISIFSNPCCDIYIYMGEAYISQHGLEDCEYYQAIIYNGLIYIINIIYINDIYYIHIWYKHYTSIINRKLSLTFIILPRPLYCSYY